MRSAGVLPVRRLRSRSSHSGPAGALSDTWAPSSRVHLAATPRQLQPLDRALKRSRAVELLAAHPPPLSASCAPREGTLCCLSPQSRARRHLHHSGGASSSSRHQRAGVACVTSPKAGVRKNRTRGGARGNKSRSPEEKEDTHKKKAIKAFPSLSPTTSAVLLNKIHWR